ncbi:MAG: CRISPR-associated protein [Ignavibacteriae bacterium]|nr:CRISPR-associated protein [Ignavibacteriota bacterium]NOH00236.1 CRISPR-associated protein [Ignavibacteriota bacterium]
MLLNLSNHPSALWSDKQKTAAEKDFKFIADLHFPEIDPDADELEIDKLAEEYLNIVLKKFKNLTDENNAVHLMGEHTFVFNLVTLLLKNNITCIASTTIRKSKIIEGKKLTEFKFVKFREYSL